MFLMNGQERTKRIVEIKKQISALQNLLQILENMENSTISSPLSAYLCSHESDWAVYISIPPQYKCKKCGAFYNC